jgi:hypothetical protein
MDAGRNCSDLAKSAAEIVQIGWLRSPVISKEVQCSSSSRLQVIQGVIERGVHVGDAAHLVGSLVLHESTDIRPAMVVLKCCALKSDVDVGVRGEPNGHPWPRFPVTKPDAYQGWVTSAGVEDE